ncbi:hypothetical protein KI387_022074, partial [Taxus chinensis]
RGYAGRWGYDRTSHPPFPQYRRDDVEAPLPAPQPLDPDWVAERSAGEGVDDAGVAREHTGC